MENGKRPKVMQILKSEVRNNCGDMVDNESMLKILRNPKWTLWTRASNGTACFGDSGGLVADEMGRMVGVISAKANSAPCKPGEYNFAVKLSSVLDFVRRYCVKC